MIMRLFVILSIFILVACEPPKNPSRPVIKYEVEVVVPSSQECACPGAKNVVIKNKSGSGGRITVDKYTQILNSDTVDTTRVTYDLPGNSSRTFSCTLDVVSNSDSSCLKQNVYNFRGKQYPKPLQDLNKDLVIDIVQGNISSAPGSTPPNGNCFQNCKFGTGSCLTFPAGSDKDLGIKIANLISSTDTNGSIPVSKIMELTASGENECNRTDIGYSNGIAYNYGDSCEILGTLPASQGNAVMTVDNNFMFNVRKLAGVGQFQMTFPKDAGGINVKFSDSALNQAYGGFVRQIHFADKLYAIESGAGACVAVDLE